MPAPVALTDAQKVAAAELADLNDRTTGVRTLYYDRSNDEASAAWRELMVRAAWVAGALLAVAVLSFLLPALNLVWIAAGALTVVFGGASVLVLYQHISQHDPYDFSQVNPGKLVDLSDVITATVITDGGSEGGSGGGSGGGAQCVGAACCTSPATWDATTGRCIYTASGGSVGGGFRNFTASAHAVRVSGFTASQAATVVPAAQRRSTPIQPRPPTAAPRAGADAVKIRAAGTRRKQIAGVGNARAENFDNATAPPPAADDAADAAPPAADAPPPAADAAPPAAADADAANPADAAPTAAPPAADAADATEKKAAADDDEFTRFLSS